MEAALHETRKARQVRKTGRMDRLKRWDLKTGTQGEKGGLQNTRNRNRSERNYQSAAFNRAAPARPPFPGNHRKDRARSQQREGKAGKAASLSKGSEGRLPRPERETREGSPLRTRPDRSTAPSHHRQRKRGKPGCGRVPSDQRTRRRRRRGASLSHFEKTAQDARGLTCQLRALPGYASRCVRCLAA